MSRVFSFSCAAGVISVAMSGVQAFQDQPSLVVPTSPTQQYESEIPENDPLRGEAATVSRVQEDAARLQEMGGDALGDDFPDIIGTLFDAESSDAERLDAATALNERTADLDSADRVQWSLRKQVKRRARLVKAGVSALKSGDIDDEGRRIVNEFLVRTAVDFESSNREAYAAESRRLYVLIKKHYPTVHASLRPVMSDEYFNYNLHFIVSEPMLAELVSDHQRERGGIAECILGAWVTGCQVTDTSVTADIIPSSNTAAFQLIAQGRTKSNTQGRKKPATVYTHGDHSFRIGKNVYFNGRSITSQRANIWVDPNNRTVGLKTDYDKIPIVRRIVRKIALNQVAEKKGQSEAIAARKLSNRALPTFEREVGARFAEANANLRDNFLADLKRRKIAPDNYSARSSETHLAMSTRTIRPGTLSAAAPPETPAPIDGLAIQAHESVINAAFTSLNLQGPTTAEQLLETIESALEEMADKQLGMRRPRPKAKVTDFDFEKEDAIRVRFDENQIVLLFRTGFYQYARGEERPAEPTLDKQIFEIPIDIRLEGGEIVLTPPPLDNLKEFGSRIKQRPADSSQRGASALRRAIQARRIALEIISAVFANSENPEIVDKEKRVPAVFDVQMGDGRRLKLRATRFEVSDGWITAVVHK